MYFLSILLHVSHVMRKSVLGAEDQGVRAKRSVQPQKLTGDLNLESRRELVPSDMRL